MPAKHQSLVAGMRRGGPTSEMTPARDCYPQVNLETSRQPASSEQAYTFPSAQSGAFSGNFPPRPENPVDESYALLDDKGRSTFSSIQKSAPSISMPCPTDYSVLRSGVYLCNFVDPACRGGSRYESPQNSNAVSSAVGVLEQPTPRQAEFDQGYQSMSVVPIYQTEEPAQNGCPEPCLLLLSSQSSWTANEAETEVFGEMNLSSLSSEDQRKLACQTSHAAVSAVATNSGSCQALHPSGSTSKSCQTFTTLSELSAHSTQASQSIKAATSCQTTSQPPGLEYTCQSRDTDVRHFTDVSTSYSASSDSGTVCKTPMPETQTPAVRATGTDVSTTSTQPTNRAICPLLHQASPPISATPVQSRDEESEATSSQAALLTECRNSSAFRSTTRENSSSQTVQPDFTDKWTVTFDPQGHEDSGIPLYPDPDAEEAAISAICLLNVDESTHQTAPSHLNTSLQESSNPMAKDRRTSVDSESCTSMTQTSVAMLLHSCCRGSICNLLNLNDENCSNSNLAHCHSLKKSEDSLPVDTTRGQGHLTADVEVSCLLLPKSGAVQSASVQTSHLTSALTKSQAVQSEAHCPPDYGKLIDHHVSSTSFPIIPCQTLSAGTITHDAQSKTVSCQVQNVEFSTDEISAPQDNIEIGCQTYDPLMRIVNTGSMSDQCKQHEKTTADVSCATDGELIIPEVECEFVVMDGSSPIRSASILTHASTSYNERTMTELIRPSEPLCLRYGTPQTNVIHSIDGLNSLPSLSEPALNTCHAPSSTTHFELTRIYLAASFELNLPMERGYNFLNSVSICQAAELKTETLPLLHPEYGWRVTVCHTQSEVLSLHVCERESWQGINTSGVIHVQWEGLCDSLPLSTITNVETLSEAHLSEFDCFRLCLTPIADPAVSTHSLLTPTPSTAAPTKVYRLSCVGPAAPSNSGRVQTDSTDTQTDWPINQSVETQTSDVQSRPTAKQYDRGTPGGSASAHELPTRTYSRAGDRRIYSSSTHPITFLGTISGKDFLCYVTKNW